MFSREDPKKTSPMFEENSSTHEYKPQDEIEEGNEHLQLRPYQLEMLHESMEKNIIVAMDTGSGKTFIAVSRIKAELEKCLANQMVWFLAPTVALASQQHDVISEHLPSYPMRLLSGADGVDHWSEQSIWDEVFHGIRVVVSTHQVLLDALGHGFVRMSQLALLVFDEAHHCNADHPANKIMQDFYHSLARERKNHIPAILGLTASPITSKKSGGLEIIEGNLDAISRTPKLHREEMLKFVHQPTLFKLVYSPDPLGWSTPSALATLGRLCMNLDIEQDPYVKRLRADPNMRDSTQLRQALFKKKTHCQELIHKLFRGAENTWRELGSWASEYFIRTCLEKFRSGAGDRNFELDSVDNAEKLYLQLFFAQLDLPPNDDQCLQDGSHLSPKVRSLIKFLKGVENANFAGLIFAQTRATVAALAHLLSRHIWTKDAFSVSTFVGTSSNTSQKSHMVELLDVKNQKQNLDDLRHGRKNLIIATSALEEGIDVSACNNVICFEKPSNLKSLIQRRGRARKSKSNFAIMFEEGSDLSVLSSWFELEDEMRRTYMDEMRRLREIQFLELTDEGSREFKVETTGAKLTLSNAVQHLYYFCDTLLTSQYVDSKPVFSFSDTSAQGATRTITGEVLLPSSVDASVRKASSKRQWVSQSFAKKDAAFEAYVALFHAGLVNENLLPLRYDKEIVEACAVVEGRPGVVDVPAQLDPWSNLIVPNWEGTPVLHESVVDIRHERITIARMVMILPQPVPKKIDFELYWDYNTLLNATIQASTCRNFCHEHLSTCAQATALMLRSVFKNRMDKRNTDFACLFTPYDARDLQNWIAVNSGTRLACGFPFANIAYSEVGLVRDLANNGVPHTFQGISRFAKGPPSRLITRTNLPHGDNVDDDRYLKVTRLSKRADFLHKIAPQAQNAITDAAVNYLPINQCEIDNLSFEASRFALFIPSIMHQVEVHVAAESLCNSLLSSLKIADVNLVISAVSAPVSREMNDYQRLEFLGDSVLKYYTSLTLSAQHLNWHEGILSGKKDHLVSNGRLSISARQTGLANYIRTIPFTGHKWRPLFISDVLNKDASKSRQISTKTLADVVEALIGAAYVDGGDQKVLACLKLFLPEIAWVSLAEQHQILYNAYCFDMHYPPHFAKVEELINHTFTRKVLLVEALTHASHQGPYTSASYQRLEFLGDSILDSIVVLTAYKHQPSIPTPLLHLMRTVLVNASFLAFLCLTFSISGTRAKVVSDHHQHYSTIQIEISLYIWQFMRHSNPAIRTSQQACLARYESLCDKILDSLNYGTTYPWVSLAKLDPPKYFSDLIESLLGAIYIDTHGSLPACESFLDRLGVMRYLQRIMNGPMALLHPKEELGQLANAEKVQYQLAEEKSEGGEGLGKLICTVLIGEQEIVRVRDGTSINEVETRAAAEAVEILKKGGKQAAKTGLNPLSEATHDAAEGVQKETMDDCDEDHQEYYDCYKFPG